MPSKILVTCSQSQERGGKQHQYAVAQQTKLIPLYCHIQLVADGKFVIAVDNEDRENEGDLIIAAEKVTTEQMAFLIRHSRYKKRRDKECIAVYFLLCMNFATSLFYFLGGEQRNKSGRSVDRQKTKREYFDPSLDHSIPHVGIGKGGRGGGFALLHHRVMRTVFLFESKSFFWPLHEVNRAWRLLDPGKSNRKACFFYSHPLSPRPLFLY